MRSDDEMIAYALETPLALLDYIPELLTDLEELGGDAQAITSVIKTLDLSESATVVDLGCGKGAVAVEVADRLKLRVLGIDLFEPFVEHCKGLAESRGYIQLFRHCAICCVWRCSGSSGSSRFRYKAVREAGWIHSHQRRLYQGRRNVGFCGL